MPFEYETTNPKRKARQAYTNDASHVAITPQDSPGIDAFGRLRVSQPETLFDSKLIHDTGLRQFQDLEKSGTGTSTSHDADRASVTIGVSNATAGRRIRQTFMRFNYQPGKSHLVLCTGILLKGGAGAAGITRGFGYYDDDNGIFLRDNEGTVEIVRRTNSSGTPSDDAFAQADWNIDRMDGSHVTDEDGNKSKITLDFSKTQILFVDFEWLGVGRVRVGFVVDGLIYYVHEFLNANVLDVVYMSTPNLPVRYEIENDGSGPARSLEHICSTVISEGGQHKTGFIRSHRTGVISSLTTANKRYLLASFRLNSDYFGASVDLEKIAINIDSQNNVGYWELVVGGTFSAGTPSYTYKTDTALDIANGDGTIEHSGGVVLDGGFADNILSLNWQIPTAERLGVNINGIQQVWSIVFEPFDNQSDADLVMTWRELL